jgi:hypothetical protein
MRRSLTILMVFSILASCHSERRGDPSPQAAHAQRQRDEEQDRKIRTLESENERLRKEVARLWSKAACNSDSVKEFLKTCEHEGAGCSGWEVANNFTPFIDTQNHVRVYLRPDTGIQGMIKLRQTQLENQTDPSEIHPSSRFIVIALPQSNSSAHQEEAERIGRQVVRYLREKLNVPLSNRILGPKTLPCNYKRKEILKVTKRIDERQFNEPLESDPTIHVWIFRTECV